MPVLVTIKKIRDDFPNAGLISQHAKEILGILPQVGDDAHKFMQTTILTNKVRKSSSTNLEKSIDINKRVFPHKVEIGIGNIERLKQKAPYWNTIDQGAKIAANSRPKQFVPGLFIGKEFKYLPGNKTGYMLPQGLGTGVVINPMHYVAKTFRYVDQELRKRLVNKKFFGFGTLSNAK